MRQIIATALCLSFVVLSAGCLRGVKSEGTHQIGEGKVIEVQLPAGKLITVEYASSDNVSVMAYLVSKEDGTKVMDAVEGGNKTFEQALKEVKPASNIEGAGGKLTSPRKDESTQWSLLLTAKKATTVTVKTKGE